VVSISGDLGMPRQQPLDQTRQRVDLAHRHRVQPERTRASQPRHIAEAVAPAPQIIAIAQPAQHQAHQHQRRQQIQQQRIEQTRQDTVLHEGAAV